MKQVLILGARSFVAIPLVEQLLAKQITVIALSRQPEALGDLAAKGCKVLNFEDFRRAGLEPDALISLMPVWESAKLLPTLNVNHLKKAVVISSSSIVNKKHSKWPSDNDLVARLERAESEVQGVFFKHERELIILRPTMVFGYGKDQNISLILRHLKRFPVMPLFGKATGLRQPIHADDLAKAICLILEANIGSQTFELGGASQLAYKDMVAAVARASRIPYLALPIPRALMIVALNLVKLIPRYRFLELAMFERMNEDLVVDNQRLEQMTGYQPRRFQTALQDDAGFKI